ncbi:hypothetical protein F511_44289 [Dorcoceras hygrometricum]|uniref:Uncharacterized protein n=1 Tax=Dorcoceras hygrometricum TaxID=472368 RepID=A0A2Z7DI32_9LAMI|nr:hypothetical protein F511_44289 [Dorcoceras hygrometricum]
MNSRSLEPVVKNKNQTSCEEKSGISNDDVSLSTGGSYEQQHDVSIDDWKKSRFSNDDLLRSARAGSAMMTSAVMSSQSAVSYSTTSRWYLKLAIAKRCRLDKLKRRRFEVPLGFSRCSLRCRKIQCFAFPVDKNPDAVVEVSTSSEAVNEFYYEDLRKLDVNC